MMLVLDGCGVSVRFSLQQDTTVTSCHNLLLYIWGLGPAQQLYRGPAVLGKHVKTAAYNGPALIHTVLTS
mgnify:CR=1 FL=1